MFAENHHLPRIDVIIRRVRQPPHGHRCWNLEKEKCCSYNSSCVAHWKCFKLNSDSVPLSLESYHPNIFFLSLSATFFRRFRSYHVWARYPYEERLKCYFSPMYTTSVTNLCSNLQKNLSVLNIIKKNNNKFFNICIYQTNFSSNYIIKSFITFFFIDVKM